MIFKSDMITKTKRKTITLEPVQRELPEDSWKRKKHQQESKSLILSENKYVIYAKMSSSKYSTSTYDPEKRYPQESW